LHLQIQRAVEQAIQSVLNEHDVQFESSVIPSTANIVRQSAIIEPQQAVLSHITDDPIATETVAQNTSGAMVTGKTKIKAETNSIDRQSSVVFLDPNLLNFENDDNSSLPSLSEILLQSGINSQSESDHLIIMLLICRSNH